MRTRVFLPPVARPTGGMFVLADIVRFLAESGHDAALVCRAEGWRPQGLPLLAWDSLDLGPGDLWLIPEGWPNALAPGLTAKACCVVYVQNWAYLFSGLPQGVAWDKLPVEFLAVSEPVRHFVRESLGRDCPVLRPGIDPALFRAPASKPSVTPDAPPTVAFMPRKNKALAEQVRAVIAARRARAGKPPLTWLAIERMSRSEVAAALAAAHVFLATGFPEGCPLPPLEAMASGCLVAGFTGFGGLDYMRPVPAAWAVGPWMPLFPAPGAPGTPNGFYAADNDVLGLALALEAAVTLLETGDPSAQALRKAALATAAAYSDDAMRANVAALWAGPFAPRNRLIDQTD